MKQLIMIAVAVSAMLPAAFSDALNDDANALFAQASKQNQTRAEATSYRSAWKAYDAALEDLNQITSGYPESEIAAQLNSGQTKIAGFTLAEYRNLKEYMQAMAEAEQDPFLCALRVADRIVDGIPKARMLDTIADSCTQAGQDKKAALAIDLSLDATDTIDTTDPEKMTTLAAILADISILSKKAGLAEISARTHADALKAADMGKGKSFHDVTLSAVAHEYSVAGQFPQALEAASAIEDPYYRSKTLVDIAGDCFEAGRQDQAIQYLTQARELMSSIPEASRKDEVLFLLAETYAATGQPAQALELLGTLGDKAGQQSSKSNLLLVIADQYASAGVFGKALEVANTIPLNDIKAKALVAIANRHAEKNEQEEASRILVQAKAAADKAGPELRNEALTLIAEMYAALDQPAAALDMVASIKDEKYQPEAMARVTVKFAEAGHLDRALKPAREIADKYLQASAMSSIADGYTKTVENKKATQLLDQALTSAKTIGDPLVRDGALATIARSYANAGRFAKAFETARLVDDLYEQAMTLREISSVYAKAGHTPSALEFDQMSGILMDRYPMELLGK